MQQWFRESPTAYGGKYDYHQSRRRIDILALPRHTCGERKSNSTSQPREPHYNLHVRADLPTSPISKQQQQQQIRQTGNGEHIEPSRPAIIFPETLTSFDMFHDLRLTCCILNIGYDTPTSSAVLIGSTPGTGKAYIG